MNKVLFILITLTIYSCSETPEEHERKTFFQRQAKVLKSKPRKHSSSNWNQELITNYISKSNNPLIARSRNDSSIKEEWLFDRIENTDSAKYMIIQIGHDVSEEDGSMLRFVTDGWVYIDTPKKVLYEYDIANNCLLRWEKR